MNRRHLLLGFLAFGVGSAAKFIDWDWHFSSAKTRRALLIGGAGAMYDLNKALAQEFIKTNPLLDVVVDRGGSLQGLIAVKRGAIDLAAMTRDVTDEEDDLSVHNFLIARGNITIIVNPLSSIKNLTQDQVKGIFKGLITNWRQVGGEDAPINVVSRVYGSSTRQYMEEVVLAGSEFVGSVKEFPSTQLVAEAVAQDVNAIGYIASKDSAGIADVSSLSIDHIAASHSTILSGRYPFTHSFYLLIFGELNGSAFDFINLARSPVGQKIVEQHGLISVC